MAGQVQRGWGVKTFKDRAGRQIQAGDVLIYDEGPGTREICCTCDEPTGYCEEDNILDDEGQPYCRDCAIGAGLIEGDNGN